MKKLYLPSSLVFCILFLSTTISRSQTGCDISAIRAAFAAPGNYTELTGVTGQPCSMYFINNTSQDADLSEAAAQTLGAHMAVFNTPVENTAVTTAIYTSYTGNIWIGYKRTGAGIPTFYAMDGTTGAFTPGAAIGALFQNWNVGEPNDNGFGSCGLGGCAGSVFLPCADTYKCENGEQCTQVYADGKWNDLPCNSSSISVVEVNLCPETTIAPTSLSVCAGGSIGLPTSTILGSAPYTYSWSSTPAGFTSTSQNPTVSPTINTTYDVTVTDRYGCLSQASVAILVVPIVITISGVNAATCTGTCDGSATASATGGTGSAAFLYSWDSSPIQTTATATGLCAGTYICTVSKDDCEAVGSDLVVNSDFSSGNTGFTSSYSYVADGAGTTELNPEALYTVITGNASQVHGSFSGTGKGGSGGFMIVNGSSTANTTVWCETVSVLPNTNYVFSAWLSSVHTNSPAILQFSFNGVNTGSVFNAPSVLNQWDQFNQSWNSNVSTSVDICVVNQNTATGGNDFALDDISFKLCVPTCQDTAMVVITESGVSVDPITPSTICASGTATLAATASGGNGVYTYVWSPAVTGSGATVTATPTVTTTYTLVVSDGNSCAASPEEVTVTVSNSLAISVNSESLCYAESATLIASGGATYTWSPATDLDVSTGGTVICTPTADRTYTVTGSSGGCVGTAVATVTINPTPSSNAGADISICSGTTGTIGAASSPGYVYSWLPITDLDDASAANPTVSTTNYTTAPVNLEYIVTTSPAGCFSTDTVIVTVNPAADPTFNYSGSTFCKGGGGGNPTPTIVTIGGAFTATPAGLSIDSNTGVADLALSTVGTYTVTYTHSGSCPSSSTGVITITTIPDAQFSFGTYCQDDTDPLPLFPSGSSAGIFTTTGGLVFVSTATGEIDLDVSPAGTYTITNTITASDGCPDAVETNTITINSLPTTTVNDVTICDGATASLTASGATEYVWSDATTLGTLSASPNTTTAYTVTGTTASCSSSAVATVTVNSLPTIAVNDTNVCVNQSTMLIPSGGVSYTWSDGSSNTTLTTSPLATTSYTVIGTDAAGCTGTAVGTVTLNSSIAVSVNSATVCLGDPATLTAIGATSYVWSDGSSTNPLSISPLATTSYTVIGSDALGCTGTATTTVTVNPLPTVTVNNPPVCQGLSATLTASGASSYTWSNGSTGNPITVSPATSLLAYTVTVTGADANTCESTALATVTLYEKPIAQFDASPNPARVYDPTVDFSDQSSLDVNYWFWSFGDGDTLSPDTPNPMHTYPGDTATYSVTLKVYNAGFCFDSINHLVLIGPEYSFYIPNAFSPDGDGINDEFFGKGEGILEYSLMIFDRWGDFIFHTSDIDKAWDGTVNGGSDAVQQDVYVWKVALKDVYKKDHNYTGTVTVIKGN